MVVDDEFLAVVHRDAAVRESYDPGGRLVLARTLTGGSDGEEEVPVQVVSTGDIEARIRYIHAVVGGPDATDHAEGVLVGAFHLTDRKFLDQQRITAPLGTSDVVHGGHVAFGSGGVLPDRADGDFGGFAAATGNSGGQQKQYKQAVAD